MNRLIRFGDIFGHSGAIDWLRSAMSAQRLPHALIFAGPAGVGKATTARALAAAVLCHQPKSGEPCGKCDSCRAIESGMHPDLTVVYRQLVRLEKEASKARDLAADVIRNFVIGPANLQPSLNHGRVFIIEEADLMNSSAQNTLLKTLEEPPGDSLLILITDEPNALLPTIRSRSQMVRFAALEAKQVQDELVRRGQTRQAAVDAALLAGGSIGVALRWLEDGVIDTARSLVGGIDAIRCGAAPDELAQEFKNAAKAYAEKQLKRDPLASDDQATREGLAIYLRIAADGFRRRMNSLSDADAIEQECAAIDAVRQAEQYLDSNLNLALVIQQFLSSLERSLSPQSV